MGGSMGGGGHMGGGSGYGGGPHDGGFNGGGGGGGGYGGPNDGGFEKKPQNDSLLKTKLCVSWQRTGVCSFGTNCSKWFCAHVNGLAGERCRFAHGEADLRGPGEAQHHGGGGGGGGGGGMHQGPPAGDMQPAAMAPSVMSVSTSEPAMVCDQRCKLGCANDNCCAV